MPLAETSQAEPRKRGMRDVIMGLLSAAMIMAPSYLANILMNRLKIQISIAAIIALAVFLIGVFLLVRLVKE